MGWRRQTANPNPNPDPNPNPNGKERLWEGETLTLTLTLTLTYPTKIFHVDFPWRLPPNSNYPKRNEKRDIMFAQNSAWCWNKKQNWERRREELGERKR